jgi:hypothetical protein
MANLIFTGLCSGTEQKKSAKSGQPYNVTNFVDLDGMTTISVFGDLHLVKDLTPREYTLVGVSTKASFNAGAGFAAPVVGSAPAPASPPK